MIPRRLLATAALSALGLCSCSSWQGASKTSCQIIDAANKACAIFRYRDPATGVVEEVRLSPDEAAAVGAIARKRALAGEAKP